MVTWICRQNKPWAQHHHSLKLEIEVSQLGILFSTVVRAAVVGKLVILGISPLTSFILALKKASVTKLVISDILSSMFWSWHYIYLFLRHNSLLHHLVYLNQQEQVLIY